MGPAEKVFLTIWAVLFFGPVLKALAKGKDSSRKSPPSSPPSAPPPVVLRRRPGGAASVPPPMPRPRPATAPGAPRQGVSWYSRAFPIHRCPTPQSVAR